MHKIIESVELHDTLNPKIWVGYELRDEVKEKLNEIVDKFILELHENDIPVKVLDARLVGSNASFNYTENSDLDVHIIANFEDTSCDVPVLSLLYNFFKKNFNDKYDISIHGVPVELYVEDMNSSAVSNGVYSLFKDEWVKMPEPIEIPDIDITDEFTVYEDKYNKVIENNNAEMASDLVDELYLLRKDSISTDGEYGVGNLVFKEFRNRGYLNNLKQLMVDETSKELSLEALMEHAHEDNETYYRVEIEDSHGYRGGLFNSVYDLVGDDGWEDGSVQRELIDSVYDLEDLLGVAPEIYNKDAIFAYKESEFIKIYDKLKEISDKLKPFEAKLIIREIHNPKKIEYEDEKQVAVVEELNESKEDNQKLVDHVGEETAQKFFKLKPRIKSPQNDLYYWLKKEPVELQDFLDDLESTKSKTQIEREAKQGAKLLYNKNGWKIYRIDTYEAATYYGKNTKWCISGNYPGSEGQGQTYFDNYKDNGVIDYYFIISPDNHKWCYLHTENDFEDSVLWNEVDDGFTDIRDDEIPDFPANAMEVMPGFKEHFKEVSTAEQRLRSTVIRTHVLDYTEETRDTLKNYSTVNKPTWLTDYVDKLIIHKDCETVRNEEFLYMDHVQEIIIEDGITGIGVASFALCKRLTKVYIPNTVKVIARKAFAGCYELKKIYIPSSVEYMGDSAFAMCNDDLTIYCGIEEEKTIDKYNEIWNIKDMAGDIKDPYNYYDCLFNVKRSSVESLTEDVYDKEGYYNPDQDIRYKRLLRIPINKLTRDDIAYLYTIHFTKYSDGYNDNGTQHTYWYARDEFGKLLEEQEEIHGDDFDRTYLFTSNLSFPLTVYRAIRADEKNKNSISGKDRSLSWTTDINIYKKDNSMFKNATDIVSAQITPDMIQNEWTVVNYVLYSARPSYGRYAESEITLKPRFKMDKLQNLKFIDKNGITEGVLNENNQYIRELAQEVVEIWNNTHSSKLKLTSGVPSNFYYVKAYFILPDGGFLCGFGAHYEIEEVLQSIGKSNYSDQDFIESVAESTLQDLGCIRGRIDRIENYIEIPNKRPTIEQFDGIEAVLDFEQEHHIAQIIDIGVYMSGSFNSYFFDEETTDELIKKVKRYYSSGTLYEELKTKEWAIKQFSNAFLSYTPYQSLLKAKLDNITDGEWEDVIDFINSLKFPLIIYRGLKLNNIDELNTSDLGVNWTIDDELFFAPESAFYDTNYIIVTKITEDAIDYPETIQNYIYYSLRPQKGRWAESEITVKKDFKPSKYYIFKKENDELVPVN